MSPDLTRLHAVISQAVEATGDIQDVAVPLLRGIAEAFGWDVGILWIVDRRVEVLRYIATWHTPTVNTDELENVSRHMLFPTGVGLPGHVWERGEPVWIPNLSASTNFPRLPLARSAGLRSGLAFPIARGTNVLGVIELFHVEQPPPSEEVLQQLAALGQQIGRSLERILTEQALREGDAYTAAVLDAALDAIVAIDHNDRILAFNPAAERLFGYRRSDAIGQQMGELLVPPSLRAAHYAGLARYLEHGDARVLGRRIEIIAMRADGREFPVELSITRVPDITPPRFTGYIRDLSAHKQVEARQQFLADVSEILSGSLDYDKTLADVARLCVSALADWCIVYLEDDNGCIERVALVSADSTTTAVGRTIRDGSRINPNAQVGVPEVIRTGRPLLYADATTELLIEDVDDPDALRPVIEPLGVCSWMCVPLSARGRTFGAISLIATTPGRRYSVDELQLAEELARRAALAIDNARLYRAAEQAKTDARYHAERVEALAAASQAFAETGLELQPLFETIVERVAAIVGDLCIIRLFSDDGSRLEPMAVAHPNHEAANVMRSLIASTTYGPTEGLLGQVIQRGAPLLIPEWTPTQPGMVLKPEFWPYVERFGLQSVLIVPLVGRQAILGTLGVFRGRSGRPFTLTDQSFLQDLAGRAALAVENARLYGQLRDALEVRDAFVSIAAHELKTPLTTIKAFGQLLTRELDRLNDPPDRLDTLTAGLRGQINRMELLVEDLLDASRLQQRVELRRAPVDLVAVVREVLDRFEHDPHRSNQHTLVLAAAEPVVGAWDAGRIDQVITNLVSNALKYSPAGGEVRVMVRQKGDRAEVEVCDQGIGIPADEQATLFQPFSRGTARTHGIAGTGLGLYITAQIVELHGGSIHVSSQPEQGSCFTVTLPRVAPT